MSLLLEMLQATLTVSVMIMRWRDGAIEFAVGHICSQVALTALFVCRLCVGTRTEMTGDATIKLLIEYGFFIFVISSGLLANQWFYTLVDKCVPPLRCLAAVAQILHTRNAKSTGTLSFSAVMLHFLAASLRQATGMESSSVSANAGQVYDLFGEWPLNTTLARLYIVLQVLWYWGAPMPAAPEQPTRRQKTN